MSFAPELVPVPVPGTDRQIVATLVDGTPMVSLRHACEAIGLAVETQRRKLSSRSWASATQWVAKMPGDSQRREYTMIDRRTFTMWLGGIDENRVAPEIRPILVAFQAEAADALDAYFNEGGAVNPRATEDQIERIARQAGAQAAVLKALKGVVDPKHLEAKGRILLARAMGEAPELNPADVPLYVSDYLASKGLSKTLVDAKASGFGKRLKARYIVEHDREPQRFPQSLPNGTVRQVCAYTEADRALFDSVWGRHYASQIADSALTLVTGGDTA